jgi:hypothetical protein
LKSVEEDEDDDDLPAFRSAGGLGTPANSRARMLAQQREIQLKKRQSNVQSGGFIYSCLSFYQYDKTTKQILIFCIGMIRSSVESVVASSPMRNSTENQFTPAIRQFSAPKSVRDTSIE